MGRPTRSRKQLRFSDDLRTTPVVLPGVTSSLRAAFDLLLDQTGVRPIVVAEIDDMAMLHLIAREADALTLVPPVVVRDELRSRTLVQRCRILQLRESFFAIVPDRRFPNALVRELLGQRIEGAPKKDRQRLSLVAARTDAVSARASACGRAR